MIITTTYNENHTMDNCTIRILYNHKDWRTAEAICNKFATIAEKCNMAPSAYSQQGDCYCIYLCCDKDIDYIDDTVIRDGVSEMFEPDEYDLSLKAYDEGIIVRQLYW